MITKAAINKKSNYSLNMIFIFFSDYLSGVGQIWSDQRGRWRIQCVTSHRNLRHRSSSRSHESPSTLNPFTLILPPRGGPIKFVLARNKIENSVAIGVERERDTEKLWYPFVVVCGWIYVRDYNDLDVTKWYCHGMHEGPSHITTYYFNRLNDWGKKRHDCKLIMTVWNVPKNLQSQLFECKAVWKK